jgi:hypothetical protein
VSDRQSTLAHEAAHVVGGLLAGHVVKEVRLGATRERPDEAGSTSFDFPASPDVDLFGHLVAVLMGPLASGEPVPPWPLAPDPYSTDHLGIARLVNHLGLGKSDYEAALALAAHHLDDPLVKSAIATVADALGERGVLTDRQVRDALGPHLLAWFHRGFDRGEELAA